MTGADRIEREAALWVARMDAGPLDPSAQHEFECWCQRSAQHHGAFVRMEAVNARLDRASALRGLPAEPPSSRRLQFVAAIAALFVIGMGIAWRAGLFSHQPAAGRTLVTTVGEPYRAVLTDGSLFKLGTHTEATITLAPRDRVVNLDSGEAAFEVAEDAARPLVVRTPLGDVRDIGTIFSVRIQGGALAVTVDKGMVAVERSGRVLARVGAGTLYTLEPTGRATRQHQTPQQLARSFAWLQGRFAFSGQTLGEAATVFNRYNDVKIEIPDPQVRSMRFGGYYRVTDPEGFAAALEGALPITAQRHGQTITLIAR